MRFRSLTKAETTNQKKKLVDFHGINVGRYTVRPMVPLGYARHPKSSKYVWSEPYQSSQEM